nr:hypothetical protein [Cytophagales bacterium]
MELKEYIGTLNLRSFLPKPNEIITIPFEFCFCLISGERIYSELPHTFHATDFKKYFFYGNTLMREFKGDIKSIKNERAIQFHQRIYLNCNLIYTREDKVFTLDRAIGLLKIDYK